LTKGVLRGHDVVGNGERCHAELVRGELVGLLILADGMIKWMVQRRVIGYCRYEKSLKRRERAFACRDGGSAHSWMWADAGVEEDELSVLHDEILAGLPERNRRAYELVRQQLPPYRAAGRMLGIRRVALSARVVNAERLFRYRLQAVGIIASKFRKGWTCSRVGGIDAVISVTRRVLWQRACLARRERGRRS
jgi:hypothetical protein